MQHIHNHQAYMDCLEKLRLLAYACSALGTYAPGAQLGYQDSGEPLMTVTFPLSQ